MFTPITESNHMPTIDHPYRALNKGQWLRGNLHTHTTRSDGSNSPQRVLDKYAKHGYDFLAVTDHDIYTAAKDYKQWNTRGMVMIPGNEITKHGPHVLHINADRLVEPLPQRQEVIQRVNAGKGFAIVAHPNWMQQFDYAPIAVMREWIDYVGMEIYNGVIARLLGSPYATNKWDMLLAEGRKIWGFANDDSHADGDYFLGWNMVCAHERSASGVLEALRAGRFYPSTGVVINSIRVRGQTITIETENAQRIVALADYGRRFSQVDDTRIEVEFPEKATYVRFECWGAGEAFAWTQPFRMKA